MVRAEATTAAERLGADEATVASTVPPVCKCTQFEPCSMCTDKLEADVRVAAEDEAAAKAAVEDPVMAPVNCVYEAVAGEGVMVRAGFAMDSAAVGTLAVGEVLRGLETKVNSKGVTRVRFTSARLEGWASMMAGNGTTLLLAKTAVSLQHVVLPEELDEMELAQRAERRRAFLDGSEPVSEAERYTVEFPNSAGAQSGSDAGSSATLGNSDSAPDDEVHDEKEIGLFSGITWIDGWVLNVLLATLAVVDW